MPRRTEKHRADAWSDAPEEQIGESESCFLAVVMFLLLKGLIDPESASDRRRVREVHRKVLQGRFEEEVASDFATR